MLDAAVTKAKTPVVQAEVVVKCVQRSCRYYEHEPMTAEGTVGLVPEMGTTRAQKEVAVSRGVKFVAVLGHGVVVAARG